MFHEMNNFKIYIEKDYEAMSKKAADLWAHCLREKPNGVFGFATGGTPVAMYKELIALHTQSGLDFSGITTFNLDEYHPIQKENDQSYHYFMKDNLFSHVNVDMAKTNILDGETHDPLQECKDFENKLTQAGGIDLQILGLGANGHIGFNEPSDKFPRFTNYVELAESTCQANARFFASIDEVPKHSLTMGIGTIMMAKQILLLASGEKKAEIIREMLFGDIKPQVPASVLQLHPDVTFVFDEEAAQCILEILK